MPPITHTCGHTVDYHPRYRPAGRYLADLATKPCSLCRHLTTVAPLRDAALAAGLPDLEGTPKQRVWAEQIRAGFLAEIKKVVTDSPAPTGHDEISFVEALQAEPLHWYLWGNLADYLDEVGDGQAPLIRAVSWVLQQRASSWWIERRQHRLRSLLESLVEDPNRRLSGVAHVTLGGKRLT